MTFAPATIQATRQLKLRHLDMHPGTNAYPNDLDPNEVGIVGDTAHAAKGTSYHLGADQLTSDAYSRRTARDRAGLSNAASAEDVGTFKVTTAKGTFDLRHYTKWLFAQCRASAPDTLDLREVIGTVDGRTVLRWDAERGRSSEPRSGEADSSHLWHTHKSWYRDSEFRDASKAKLDARYLAEIGLIEGVDMPLSADDLVKIWTHDLKDGTGVDKAYVVLNRAAAQSAEAVALGKANAAAIAALSVPAPAPVDPAALKAALLDPEFLAAVARAVIDEDHRRSAQ